MFDYVLVLIIISFCIVVWYIDAKVDVDNYDKGYTDGITHYRLSLQLKALREHSKKTLREVSQDTGIELGFIRSIEQGDFEALKRDLVASRCKTLFDYYGMEIAIVHTVTYNLHTYEEVLDKSKLVQEAGGVIVSVKTTPNAFDDCKKSKQQRTLHPSHQSPSQCGY